MNKKCLIGLLIWLFCIFDCRSDVLIFLGIEKSNNVVTIYPVAVYNSFSLKSYPIELQRSTNLINWGVIAKTNSSFYGFQFTDVILEKAFYRIKINQYQKF